MQAQDLPTDLAAPLVRAELARILASTEFEGADRMVDLLQYLVTSVLEGRADHLKESVIGVQVFGRDIGYDTKLDPVVRVSAGRLRQRLVRYYERTGNPPDLRIELNKGGYVPRFVPVVEDPSPAPDPTPAPALPAQPVPEPAVIPPQPAVAQVPIQRRSPRVLIASLSLVAVTIAGYFLWQSRNALPLIELLREARQFTNAPGTVGRPSLSPDAKIVAFDWYGPGDSNRHIYLQPVDADSPVRFTDTPGHDTWPIWSADGAWIAFMRRDEQRQFSIVLKAVVGGNERVLTQVDAVEHLEPKLDWRPQGDLFVVPERKAPRQPSRLILIDAKTGTQRTLTSPPPGIDGDSEATFSPDGSLIAFRRTSTSNVDDLYVVPVAGGEPKQIISDRRGISSIAWRTDGKALIYCSRRSGSNRQLWEYPLSGGEPVRLTPAAIDAFAPNLSRDGRSIVFVQAFEDKNIYAIPLDGSGPRQRIISSVAQDSDPAISPDGKLLSFRSNRTGADEIWIANIDGSNERRLTRMECPNTGAAKWSPDQRYIYYASRLTTQSDAYRIPLSGGNAELLTPPETPENSPYTSPDHHWLYYSSNRTGVQEVWRQPLSGGRAEQVTTGGASSPKLSRDGKTLYYSRNVGKPGLFELALDRELPAEGKRIADMHRLLLGHWNIASSGVYFVDVGPEENTSILKYFSFATRKVTERVKLPGIPSFYDGGLGISPDEKTAYYTTLDRVGSVLVLASARK